MLQTEDVHLERNYKDIYRIMELLRLMIQPSLTAHGSQTIVTQY
jgi:hypothetical protein